jgi:hypothetical protein
MHEYSQNIIKNIQDLYNLEVFIRNSNIDIEYITKTRSDNDNQFILSIFTTTQLTELQHTIINDIIENYDDSINMSSDTVHISKINSTNNPLMAKEIYEGIYEDISRYSTLSVNCISDVNGLLEIYFSNDKKDTHFVEKYNVIENKSTIDIKTITFKYYKIKYTNSYNDQTLLNIQSVAHLYRTTNIPDTTTSNIIEIKEEHSYSKTGGHFRTESKHITIPGNKRINLEQSWKYDISLLELRFLTLDNQFLDEINCYIGMNTVIGISTENAYIGENKIRVSKSVMDVIKKGYLIRIDSGEDNNIYFGEVIDIDLENPFIILSDTLSYDYLIGSIIYMTINPIRNFIIGTPHLHTIGSSKIGSSSITKNTILSLEYVNKTDETKHLIFYYDYLY